MSAERNLLHWSNLLFAAIVIASLPITQGGGGAPPPDWFDPAVATIVAQVGLILIPTLIFVWLTCQPPREIFKLRRISVGSGIKCFLVGLTCWPVLLFLGMLTQVLIAMVNPAQASGSTNVASQGGSPWIIFLALTLVAPLCEEALCRGLLLGVYEKRFAAHAIWLVGILFAFLHPSLDQTLGAFFVGAVAGWVVYRTRSIWAGVLAHMGANLLPAALVLLISLAAPGGVEGAAQAGDPGSMIWIGVLVWGGIGLVMLAPWFFLMRSLGKRYPAPAWPAARLSLKDLWSFAAAALGTAGYSIYQLVQGMA